jgi:tRNA(Leu) C34 or U34 (ribose-2'-O)-methylase TrmL
MSEKKGQTPAVVLYDPKYPHNVGAVLRSCAALGARQLWFTGDRAQSAWESARRIPREERLRDYSSVEILKGEGRFLDRFPAGTVPVAVEVHPGAEVLTYFEHPENAVYLFGPEDGSLPRGILTACHRVVIIPSDHCLNLATAVSGVLLHRRIQRQLAGLEDVRPAAEMMLEPRHRELVV